MSDLKLMIKGASSDDDDAYFLTSLATVWSRRMPALAQLRLFMDGRESVDSNSVPQGVDPDAAPVYRTMRSLGVMNFARRISESVTDRQQPNGFRKVEDTSLRDTEADLVAKRCGLPALLRRFMFPQKGTYGCSFGFVTRGRGKRSIIALSPWECWMSDDADSAIMYSHDERSGVERMRLFRILRDDKTGEPKEVYSRLAVRDSDRTVVDPNDYQALGRFLDKYSRNGALWIPGDDWRWDGDKESCDYALQCESLPIVRLSTIDGLGLFEPYIPTLQRIDRQVFDRLCITMMQAFRQRAIKGDLPLTYGDEDPEVLNGEASFGDPIDYSKRFATSPAALWQLPQGVDIWESQTVDTTPLMTIISNDIKHLAAASGTPLDILSPDVQGSASGAELKRETLKFKVQTMNELDSEPIVRMVRMAIALDGGEVPSDSEFEMVWKPMETTSSLELAQAAQLLYQSGLLARRTVLTHKLGFTAQDVAEDDMNRMADQFNVSDGGGSSSQRPVMTGAVAPATGWDAESQSAVDGLEPDAGDSDGREV